VPYAQRAQDALVRIDNPRARDVITEHLLSLGCRCIIFVGLPHAAATVNAREAGYRETLYAHKGSFGRASLQRLDPEDVTAVRKLLESMRPDGIVCANYRTAGRLLHSIRQLRHRVPQDIRLVGIDDVEYARLLPVPLSTLRQPTHQIGELALALMLERIARPTLPPREVRLGCELIVRESCGAAMARGR